MIIKSFKAHNFRNIKDCSLEFSDKVNILLGENAQGKTNAIEGIYFFARGRSFRKADERELINFGEKGFSISIEYEDKNGENTLEYAIYEKEKRRRKNGYKINKVSEMIGNFKAVLFCPDDLTLVKGGPEERRDFLNIAISQCYPSYINVYSNYKKALENRNAILKNASKNLYFDESELVAWSSLIAEYAADIFTERVKYIKKLAVFAKKYMKDISDGKEDLSVSYKSDIMSDDPSSLDELPDKNVIKEKYKKIFSENISRERLAGVTLFGPHRDDVLIKINEKEARVFASQGQQRSIVLALKMSEGEVCKELFSEYPVFLFDDVLSELDERRQSFVLSGVSDRQIIITSCERLRTAGTVTEVCGGVFV